MFVTVLLGCSCVCIGAMLIFTITKKAKYNMKRTPPGPSGLPFIGQGLSLSVNNAHLTFAQWTKEYGDIFAFTLFGKRVIVLNEPDVIRKAFASSEYSALLNDRPPSFIGEYIADRYKDVLFRADDDICRRLKHLTMKAMYDIEQTSESYKCKMQEEINDYVSVIAASAGSDIDVIAPLDHTFCKMISLMFTGERPSDTEEFLKAIEAFDFHGNAMIMPSTHLLLKNLPCLRFLPGYYGSLCRSMATDKDQLKKFLVEKMKNASVSQEKGVEAGECSGLLHALNRYKTAETWLTDEFILGIVMDLINTSTLTSRGVVSGFIFLIVHFQEVQRKIYAEIRDVIGKERKPRSSDLAEMPYTHACILETLRYQSHLGITATHTSLSQEVMFDGFLIPKGASVYGNQWNVHHDERFWTEPFEFRPERFLQTDGSLLPVDHDNRRRNFMPFGVGGRACMGISMTYNRMFLFATTLIQTYALLPPSNHELPAHHPSKLRPGTVLQAPEFFCKVVPR